MQYSLISLSDLLFFAHDGDKQVGNTRPPQFADKRELLPIDVIEQ
jgi:hypothetical protein